MGQYIVKLDDYYLTWSTVVDAPTEFGMMLDEFNDEYQRRYGEEGMDILPYRMARVKAKGNSANDLTNDDLLAANRAGPNETELTREEIVQAYCKREPIGDWLPE